MVKWQSTIQCTVQIKIIHFKERKKLESFPIMPRGKVVTYQDIKENLI